MSVSPEPGRKEAISRWGSILTVMILSGICLLSLVLNYKFASASQEVLAVSIQANRLADYSVDPVSSPIPVLKMQIIEDVIEDQEPTNVLERLEVVQENLQTVVPTVTPTPPVTNTPVPGGNEPVPTVRTGPTKPPSPTSTSPPAGTSVGSAKTATVTPTGTLSGHTATNTPVSTGTATSPTQGTPTATDRPTYTETKVPTSTPTATKRVGKPPTATSVPTNTATNTLPPLPTATNTPTRTPPPPTATKTPTRTPPPPTATMTPTSECSWPDWRKGFVAYTIPADNAVDIPLDVTVKIQFNQAMYTEDLYKNIKVSGTNVNYLMSYDPGNYQVEIDFIGLLKKASEITVEVKRNVTNSCQQRQLVSVKFTFITIKK